MFTLVVVGLFDNTITFRKTDATIELPTFEGGVSGDIRFQFKTTTENGILLQNTGSYHFIELKLVCKFVVCLEYHMSFVIVRRHLFKIYLVAFSR